eukprot:m.234374 g.234374  ORF g.234374 m.234374 type:complete len:59 (+) comp40109_c0_seq17:125-301(+)
MASCDDTLTVACDKFQIPHFNEDVFRNSLPNPLLLFCCSGREEIPHAQWPIATTGSGS